MEVEQVQQSPIFTRKLEAKTAIEHDTVELECQVTGEPSTWSNNHRKQIPLKHQWKTFRFIGIKDDKS